MREESWIKRDFMDFSDNWVLELPFPRKGGARCVFFFACWNNICIVDGLESWGGKEGADCKMAFTTFDPTGLESF